MPEFTPAEYDRCPYCGSVLYHPPICCKRMADNYSALRSVERREFEEEWGEILEEEAAWETELEKVNYSPDDGGRVEDA